MSARRGLLWFGLAFVALFGVVAWISSIALRLETAELEARRQSTLEQSVRLALWRMDSSLLPFIARENARVLDDAAIRERPPALVRQFFRMEEDQAVERVRAADLLAALPVEAPPPATSTTRTMEQDFTEWDLRNASLEGCAQVVSPGRRPLTALWIHGELVLARRTGPRSVEGVWLDWPQLQRSLPEQVGDLLPTARLGPASPRDEAARRLAALPLTLQPGELAVSAPPAPSPVRLGLAVAWAGLVLATLAVFALTAGTLSLSEKRATFVSAVTHELRTPLTTLQTYTEMLASGKITDPATQAEYLATLHQEAVRLTHLVQNVLAFSGVERGQAAAVVEGLELGAVLDRCRERLANRVAQAGRSFVVDGDRALRVLGAMGPIEQILFNLVDNAAKHGAGDVRLSTTERGSMVEVRVIDQGRGVSEEVRSRLFEPFSRSAESAAGAVAGVGLGLALSRSLAQAMGGTLRLEPSAQGACFVLSLRRG